MTILRSVCWAMLPVLAAAAVAGSVSASAPEAMTGYTAPGNIPFMPGERLTFEIRWLFIPAGTATLEVLPLEMMDGKPVWHFVLKAATNSFADAFYKVRDRIDAYTDLDMTHTVYFKKKQREGDTKRDVEVLFDWEKSQAVYIQDGKREKPVDIQPGAFDPLSIFYHFRAGDLSGASEIQAFVTDGKKCVTGRAAIVKKQEIKAPAGTYKTILVEPELKHIGGVFKESKDAVLRIWFSQGPERHIVRIKSKVVVGSFSAELVSVEKVSPEQMDQVLPQASEQ